ncbi:hypothetical protein DTO271G3_1853 [Paecilomyces variotii]|nr:hypothetical protein DTO271G3_1853 [Paecilomyces variotii]
MASRYSLVDYDSDEEVQKYPRIPISNLTSAAFFVAGILEQAGIQYGIMGGMAVKLMGGMRDTRDVDIAFDAPGKMRDLWRVLEVQTRLIIPKERLISNIMRIFVRTGPGYDNCSRGIPVEVDLIECGYQNSPRDLGNHRTELQLTVDSAPRSIYVIDILYLLRGKMAAFMSRGSDNDRDDITYLLRAYPEAVQGIKDKLDPIAVDCFLESVSSENREYWTRFFGH